MGAPRDWLRLARAPLAPTAAFDAVACAWLARAAGFGGAGDADLLAAGPLLALVGTSLLVYAAGMAGNDLADRARDRALHPDRPIPSGTIRPAAAAAFVLVCATGALLLGGGGAGSRWAVAGACLAALAYDGGAKRSVVGGSVCMGLARFANASTAVWPLVASGRAAPLALLAPAAIGAYSAAITLLSTTEEGVARRRELASRALSFAAFAGAGILSMLGAQRLTVGALVAGATCASIAFGRVPRPGPVGRRVLEMLLGIYFLDAILASGAREGDWPVAVGALVAAFLASLGSQIAVRALRPRT